MNSMAKTKKAPPRSGVQKGTAKKRAFLSAYAGCMTVTHAAEAAKITRRTHYKWLEKDSEYATAFGQAKEEASDHLESEARRRAVDGVEEKIYHKGEVVGTKLNYSDTLLIFLLKGVLPHKYRDRVDMAHTGTVTLEQILAESWEKASK